MSGGTYYLEDVVVVVNTGKAFLLRMTYETEVEIPDEFEDNVNQWWVPHSIIEDCDVEEVGDQGYVEVPIWFAKKEEMPDAD